MLSLVWTEVCQSPYDLNIICLSLNFKLNDICSLTTWNVSLPWLCLLRRGKLMLNPLLFLFCNRVQHQRIITHPALPLSTLLCIFANAKLTHYCRSFFGFAATQSGFAVFGGYMALTPNGVALNIHWNILLSSFLQSLRPDKPIVQHSWTEHTYWT